MLAASAALALRKAAILLAISALPACQKAGDQPAPPAPERSNAAEPEAKPPPVVDPSPPAASKPAGPVIATDPPPPANWVPSSSPRRPPPPRQRDKPGPLTCLSPVSRNAIPEWIGRVRVFEIDGDGNLDAVLLYSHMTSDNKFFTMAEILLGDGKGGFSSVQSFPVGDMVLDVAAADFDEDGRTDLIMADFKSAKMTIYRNQGDGRVKAAATIKTGRRVGEFAIGDFDNDGHVDVVVTLEKQMLEIFTGTGKGSLRRAGTVTVGKAPERPAVADLDGDGNLDIVVLSNDSHTAMALLGRGDASFKVATRVATCTSPTSLEARDFDGDGATDVAFTCIAAPDLHFLFNRATGTKLSAARVGADVLDQIAAGDLDGDGHEDLVGVGRLAREQRPSGYRLASKLFWFAGDGKGGFTVRDSVIEGADVSDPVMVDINNDGRQDLVAAYWEGRRPGYIGVWLGRSCKQ